MGGMRAERRKWPMLMQTVDCAIFVASLSEWGQTLAEDRQTNRLSESLNLFETTMLQLSELCAPPSTRHRLPARRIAPSSAHPQPARPRRLAARRDVPTCLFLTKDDELRKQLASDAPRCLKRLGEILGHPVGCEPGGDGPIDDILSQLSSEQLHARVIGSITRRFEQCGHCAMSFVLDATNSDAARKALDAAAMLTLTTFARSGRGHTTSNVPSSTDENDTYNYVMRRSLLHPVNGLGHAVHP